jgi:hypothetical protein
MEPALIIIGIITLLFIWWNLLISLKIINYLKSKGEAASLFNNRFFIKGKIFKFLPLYRKITFEKDGKVGPLYFLFYMTFLVSLLFLSAGIFMAAS